MSADPLQPEPASVPPQPPPPLLGPKSEDPKDLGFTRQKMVDWLAPGQLIQTGIKAIVSDIFGAYADKRDVMAALYPKSEITGDYSHRSELWIDYAADLGDGFDATYTVAWLLAKKQLAVRYGEKTLQLPRGDVLVMGGDQVYPTASFDEYSNRLLKPYEAALPHVPAGEAPDLYAIPGNHDWYDGLSNFSRIFCQKKWVGGRKTQQRRSYFAVKLPHNWWLWGIDIQLEGFIDEPQLRYFYEIGKHEVQDGDRVILCTAEPSWVYGVTKGAEAFASLRYFEDRYIRNAETHKARLAVTLTGDLHHYVRYESQDAGGETQRITAGGGGAYLYATHDMPEELVLEEGFREGAHPVTYKKEASFPDKKTSTLLTFGSLLIPIRSWKFGLFLSVFYTLFSWILQSASKTRPDLLDNHRSLMEYLHDQSLGNWWPVLKTVSALIVNTPVSVLLCLIIVGGFMGFCSARRKISRFLIGSGHGVAHVLLNLALMWLFARVNPSLLDAPLASWPQALLFVSEMLLFGGILGGVLMALYLLLFSFVGRFHLAEAYSSQRLPSYKNFLRIHLDSAGNLKIYPIGIRKAGKWKLRPNAPEGEPWFEPDGAAPQPELIEDPIPVPRERS
ncbi:MAG: metallophosphoesterase [Thermoanaerobaculia bacterium]